MTKNALVDVDDTIAQTQITLIDYVNRTHGGSYEYEKLDRHYREDTSPEVAEWTKHVTEAIGQPKVMETIKPAPDALEGFLLLVANGISPHIVTARKEHLFETTAVWLKTHGFADHVYHVHPRGQGETGVEFKQRIARAVGFDVAFDDTHEVCVALAELVPVVYMPEKPWNNDPVPDNVIRVESFAAGVKEYVDACSQA